MPNAVTEIRGTFYDPEELVRRRFRMGLTQAEVAELAGITPGFLSKLESGKYGGASPATLGRLAAAFGCTIADLERRAS